MQRGLRDDHLGVLLVLHEHSRRNRMRRFFKVEHPDPSEI